MDLLIKDHRFIVCGAGAGFGRAVAEALAAEGARVLAVARREEGLQSLRTAAPDRIDILTTDLTHTDSIGALLEWKGTGPLHGILVNAGGPPAKTFMETDLNDWDDAYRNLVRWKVELTQRIVSSMMDAGYGRMLYIESSSVKQPLENLVLSNSLRLAVTGFVKTLSQEISRSGVTLNILAPGSHDTAAIERLYRKKSEQTQDGIDEVRKKAVESIPVGRLGDPKDLASLAAWLLSPHSKYITGQTISVDGGVVRGLFG